MRFDLSKGFPLLTTKKLHLRSILIELLWFLRGDTNVRWLQENKVSIWDEWADEAGDLGPVYGKQWRRWEAPDGREIDQIADLIELIRRDPGSRRQIVSAWNPGRHRPDGAAALPSALPDLCRERPALAAALPAQRRRLPGRARSTSPPTRCSPTCSPSNAGLEPGDFVWTGGDCHLYSNHLEQAREQLSRDPRPLPKLTLLRRPTDIGDYRFEDFEITGYDPHPHIKAEVAV